MKEKWFVLVSQGIEIYRTQSQELAIYMVLKGNNKWFKYRDRCIENCEEYADNYISLEVEYIDDENFLSKKKRNKSEAIMPDSELTKKRSKIG